MGKILANAIGAAILGVLVVGSLALLDISAPLAWVIAGSMGLGTLIGIAA